MVHLYYGDGKGKTTAAIGQAVRMAGSGAGVFFVQFLKGQPSAEVRMLLSMPGMTVLRGKAHGRFAAEMTAEDKEAAAALHERQLELAADAALRGEAQMIVLDEVLDAVDTGLLSLETLLSCISRCRDYAEIVLTGRNPAEEILDYADYVTQMIKEKHPFDQGIVPRKGIEY